VPSRPGASTPLAQFERLVESLVERSMVAPLRGPIHPREIARRLERALESGALLEVDRQLAPNDYRVRLNPSDFEKLSAARTTLETELARYLARAGGDRGLTFLTLPTVHLGSDTAVPARTIEVEARLRDAAPPLEPPVDQGGPADSGWLLEVAGRQVRLPYGTLRVGRAPDCEVVLPSTHVSRYHAELIVDAAGARLRDLGSTNGTSVNGQPAHGEPLTSGATLSFGGITATIQHAASA
jgi:hypothetical protein